MFRKNKVRKYRCTVCGCEELNRYYGIKKSKGKPILLRGIYELNEKECAWCKHRYFYLTKKGV